MMQFPRIWGSNEQKNKEAQTIPEDSQQQRFDEFLRVKQKYPDWLPIVIHSKDLTLTKQKYLTREEIPFKKFAEIVQDYCMVETPTGLQKIDRKVPLFFAVSGTLIPADETMGQVYKENKKPDGFLHIDIRQEPDFIRAQPQKPESPNKDDKTKNVDIKEKPAEDKLVGEPIKA